ncbi:MAG TPA: biosynthetic-type acetolactate synthase large subunit [Candidatus Brocadiia bacterium]|nr:biosynthetic-type acetolactate synthase large subunit [Candidatus Brocadiia bacterium]
MKGTQAVIEALRREKVEVVFGYTGAAMIPLFHDLWECRDIRFVMPRHEQAGAHAADGYARATGRPGVVFTTSGPGATNLVTGIATAYMDSIPLVAFTGQVRTSLIGNDAFQEADITGITRPVTKHNWMVKNADDLPGVLREAFHVATTGRPGPVLVDLPVDVLTAQIGETGSRPIRLAGYKPGGEGNPRQIRRAAELINASERPVLYIGGGIIASGCSAQLRELAERANLPVTTTLMGKGAFPDAHPLSLNMLGMHGAPWANLAVQNCDLLIAVGARFDDRVTGRLEKFAPFATVIHIDVDPSSISKNVRAHCPIVGDAGAVLAALAQQLERRDRAEWHEQITRWKSDYPLSCSERGVNPKALLESLAGLTRGRRTIVCTDVGQHQMWTALFYPFAEPRTLITSGGLGTMGFGLPAAVGAQIGRPDSLVVCAAGDGSIQMNIQELTTLRSNRLPVKIIVFNNGCLGMVRQWQELFFDRRYANVDLSDNPDFVAVAEAFGVKGMRIEGPSDIEGTLRRAIEFPGPVLVDAPIGMEENVFPMVPAGEAIDRPMLSCDAIAKEDEAKVS